jgi:hypothetical protein
MADEDLFGCTAWTDQGLLGGFQFARGPSRDPKDDLHIVELYECQKRQLHVVDTAGQPVAGARMLLEVATPAPYFNFLGHPDSAEVVSDKNGTAEYAWIPKWKEVHFGDVEIVDDAWVFQSQTVSPEKIEVVVKKPAERVQVTGVVSRGGQSAGGLVVEAYSFQGESEHRSDIKRAVVDEHGKFVFDALPNSTYCIFIDDDRLASQPTILQPVDSKTGQKNSAALSAFEGYPVKISVTSGPNHQPVTRQTVSILVAYDFSWLEDGRKQNGMTRRQTWVITDDKGEAVAYCPAGPMEAYIYTSNWRSEKKINVAPDKENSIQFHRARDTAVTVSGRLVAPANAKVDWTKVTLKVQAIDGECGDEQQVAVSAGGLVKFDTPATALACYAASTDGSLLGAMAVYDTTQPFTLQLSAGTYVDGQLLGPEGQGIASRIIRARPSISHHSKNMSGGIRFSKRMELPTVEVTTDANGKYRLGPLPSLALIGLSCRREASDSEESLDTIYIEPGEQRPLMIHRLGESAQPAPKLSTDEIFADLLRDSKLGGFHVMAILADHTSKACTDFVNEQLLDYNNNSDVSRYMQIRFKTGPDASESSKAYCQKRNWPAPPAGSVTAIALDANDRELGRLTVDVSGPDAKQQVARFLEAHRPPELDAKKKWEEAFALAKQTNRRVWARVSQRYCGPCFDLSRWIDDHHQLLEKEFVLLKIDNVRDIHGQEVGKEIIQREMVGIPFYAFYSSDGQRLIDSYSHTGNIGSVSGFEGKRHFRKMLETGNNQLTAAEIQQLLDSIED